MYLPPVRSCVIAGFDFRGFSAIVELLNRDGWQVHKVATASQALHLCRVQEINLVISRVVFAEDGRRNGVDLANELGGRVPIILLTEFPDAILRKIPGYPPIGVPVLRQPVDLNALEREIRRAIRREGESETKGPTS
jgi:DNA-binding response OmpR family regulator